MIHLRLPLLVLLALFCLREVSAGVARFQGFPSRQGVMVTQVAAPPAESAVKLPPPATPPINLPTQVEVEKHGDAVEVKPKAAPVEVVDTERQVRIKAERKRLNNNALVWQRERAAAGSATAQRSLAVRYLTGDGVERDDVLGMDLLRKAAAGGDSAAVKELAKREPVKKE